LPSTAYNVFPSSRISADLCGLNHSIEALVIGRLSRMLYKRFSRTADTFLVIPLLKKRTF